MNTSMSMTAPTRLLVVRRCRPGDLVRIDVTKVPGLRGRTAIVDRFDDEFDRWRVDILGAPVFGFGIRTGRPLVGKSLFFRDASLTPLRDEDDVVIDAEYNYVVEVA